MAKARADKNRNLLNVGAKGRRIGPPPSLVDSSGMAQGERRTYGKITVADAHLSTARVLINGEDVSDRVYEADDVKGYVKLFRLNEFGCMYFEDDNELAREIRKGRVEIRLWERIPTWTKAAPAECSVCQKKNLDVFFKSQKDERTLCEECFKLVPGGYERPEDAP